MKTLMRYLVLVIFVSMGITPALAQNNDPCARDSIIASFAEAASAGAVEDWAQSYASGSCSPQVKAAVRGLADIYAGLAPASAPNSGVAGGAGAVEAGTGALAYTGRYPVFEMSNALGFTFEIEADDIMATDTKGNVSGMYSTMLPNNYFAVKVNAESYLVEFWPLARFGHSEPQGDHNILTLDDGSTWPGLALLTISNSETDRQANSFTDTITLLSLPEKAEGTNYQHVPTADDVLWEVTIGEPENQTVTIYAPKIYYNNRIPNCMGMCGGPRSRTDFDIIFNEQTYPVQFNDFNELRFTFNLDGAYSEVFFVGVQGNSGSGALYLDDYQASRYLFGTLVDSENYVAIGLSGGSGPDVTMRRVE